MDLVNTVCNFECLQVFLITPPQNHDTSWRVIEGWQFDVGPHFQTWENHKTMGFSTANKLCAKLGIQDHVGLLMFPAPQKKKTTGCVGRRLLRRWIEPQPSWWPNHENLPTWSVEFGIIIIISMNSPNPHHHLQEYAWRKLSVAPWLLIWFREYGYNPHQSHTTTGPQPFTRGPWPRPHELL